jgi:hypothetical protein
MELTNLINYKKWTENISIDIENKTIEDFILQKILRKPFRKQKISDK